MGDPYLQYCEEQYDYEDRAAEDQRDMFSVLVEALNGADRVVVETKNSLGEMDAHYLHAPSLLADLQGYKKGASRMTYERAKAKADALLAAGDALGEEFPAKSRELLRECRRWRQKQRELEHLTLKERDSGNHG